MCRGKVAPRSEGNMQDAFSLFVELEGKGFLGPDNLDVLKDLLKGVKEWALLEEAEKFENKRKEYDVLLKKIIRVLDELNDVERLVSICREKIPPERRGNIPDVRSLFKELENNNCLGINRLGILKEILAQTQKSDLLTTVKDFEERRTREDKFERRKGMHRALNVFCDYFHFVVCMSFSVLWQSIFHNFKPDFDPPRWRLCMCDLNPYLNCFLARAAAIVSAARDNLTGGEI